MSYMSAALAALGGGVMLLALAGCPGRVAVGDASVGASGAAAGGAAAEAAGRGASEGGAPAPEGRPDASVNAGEGGELPVAVTDPRLVGRVREAVEAGLDAALTVQNGEQLDGASFNLATSLCPSSPSESKYRQLGPTTGLSGFHIRANPAGNLEAVTFVRAAGELAVTTVPMKPSGLGYDLAKVPACAHSDYLSEEEYKTNYDVAEVVHVVFVQASPGAPLQAKLAASDPQGPPVVSWASADTVPPRAVLVEVDRIAGVDEIYNAPFRHTYVFDEPVDPDSSISIYDDSRLSSGKAAIKPLLDEGYLVGFRVDDILSARAQVAVKLQDLAGNKSEDLWTYPGVVLDPLDGTFETEPLYLTTDDWWDGTSGSFCELGDGYGVSPTNRLPSGLKPIAGAHSFYMGGDLCTVYFRLTRPPGTSHLRFEARTLLDVNVQGRGEKVSVAIGIASLAPGGDDGGTTLAPAWPDDPELSTAQTSVSQVQLVSVDLPEKGDDFLVSFQANRSLWLDSIRLE